MSSQKFARNIKEAVFGLHDLYALGESGPTALGYDLDKLDLTENQRKEVLQIMKDAMMETTHCIISGIEGHSGLGEASEASIITDSHGNKLSGNLSNQLLKEFGV